MKMNSELGRAGKRNVSYYALLISLLLLQTWATHIALRTYKHASVVFDDLLYDFLSKHHENSCISESERVSNWELTLKIYAHQQAQTK